MEKSKAKIKFLSESFDREIKIKLKKLTEGLESEVDKETWGPEEVEEPNINNEELISVDGEEDSEEEAPTSALDYLLGGKAEDEVEPNKPQIIDEFDGLSNEDKKALLLKLAKNDNNLSAILSDYMNSKIDEESTPEEKEYATWATEQGGSAD